MSAHTFDHEDSDAESLPSLCNTTMTGTYVNSRMLDQKQNRETFAKEKIKAIKNPKQPRRRTIPVPKVGGLNIPTSSKITRPNRRKESVHRGGLLSEKEATMGDYKNLRHARNTSELKTATTTTFSTATTPAVAAKVPFVIVTSDEDELESLSSLPLRPSPPLARTRKSAYPQGKPNPPPLLSHQSSFSSTAFLTSPKSRKTRSKKPSDHDNMEMDGVHDPTWAKNRRPSTLHTSLSSSFSTPFSVASRSASTLSFMPNPPISSSSKCYPSGFIPASETPFHHELLNQFSSNPNVSSSNMNVSSLLATSKTSKAKYASHQGHSSRKKIKRSRR